ncbi:MAG: GNAT family N-acetyltransferase [Promethearchaeota archaeon]
MSKKPEKKTKKAIKSTGKVESHYSFDYVTKDDITDNDTQKKRAHVNRNEALGSEVSPFRGKLMRMFSPPVQKKTLIKHQARIPDEVSTYGSTEPYIPQNYKYLQMRLNIENISEEFAQELEEYRISGIQIRKAEMEDLEVFVKIYNRAFMRGSDPWSPVTAEQFSDILKHKTTIVLIASILNEDVGFIITDLEEAGKIGIICGLGTDPRWQRRGIARYLGIAAWDYFSKILVKELRCEVYENNKPSYKLIKSLHFEEYGTKTYQF